MENIEQKELLKLWKKGKTLYESLFVLTDKSLLNNYNKSQLELENQTNSFPEKESDSNISMLDGLQAVQKTINKYQGTRNATDKLKRDLLNKVLSEKLIGLGFESPIKPSDIPQYIPLHIWPQKIIDFDWDNSSFSINGVKFINIKIIKNSELKKENNLNNKKEEIKAPKNELIDKPVGRPSRKNEIEAAYNYLREIGSIDYSKTFTSHIQLIRETVRLLNPDLNDNKGLGDEAIRLYAKLLFDRDMSSQKPPQKL